MKVYRISKLAFGGICLLILLLPVSRHWKLLTTGEKTNGIVSGYGYRMVEDITGERYPVEASEIEFEVDGILYKTYGPTSFEYNSGRTLTIFYNPKDPAKNCVATFTGFYLNNYMILPIVLITVWFAFYLSFNNYRKRMKMPKGRPARPTQPTRPKIHSSRRITF